jgi:hypothetical protein
LNNSNFVFKENTLSRFNFEKNEKSYTLFPNPAKTFIQIQSKVTIGKYEIFDLGGKLIKSDIINEGKDFSIDIRILKSGFYILNLIDVYGNHMGNEKVIIH